MDNIDSSFKEQQRMEDEVSLKAMIIQVAINFGVAIIVLILFSWLRPRHAFIYAPKAILDKSDIRRPTTSGPGWFDWIKPVFKIKDDALLQSIGFDAYIFIYFTRILRRLIIVLTSISVLVFIPVNILATYTTGDWPPVGLEFLSISAMNYRYGRQSVAPNHQWYWAPTVATWVFSAIVIFQMIHASKKFIIFRQKYYIEQEEITKSRLPSMSPTELLQHQKQELISRTLLVHFRANLASHSRQPNSSFTQYITPNETVKKLVDSNSSVSCQQVLVGKYNNKLHRLIQDYIRVVKALEKRLNPYLSRVNEQSKRVEAGGSTTNIKRPQVRLNWRSKNIDAINHYTERALLLNAAIKRNRSKLQNDNFGWAIYPDKSAAHEAYLSIEKKLTHKDDPKQEEEYCEKIRLAPHPDDIVWSNMNIDHPTSQLKRWFGYGLFCSIIFAWSIPAATLAITSNMINLIRLFPKSVSIIKHNQLIMGIIQSYLTPCLMVLFYIGLPDLLRFISRQQAYKTETVMQQKVLTKLYIFFIINNLFIFTLVSIMVGILGQITALTLVGTLKRKSFSQYIVQIAKNMTDVSSFWINYACIRAVGIIFELLQVTPLIWIILLRGKIVLKYTPRQLEKVFGSPPSFDFAKNYGVVMSFFTVALVHSVTAPIVLPFALLYFGLATTIFKYKLIYIYVTKVETHGKIWPTLYCIVMMSVIVFQAMMILILSLKAGMAQIYTLIPLPFITAIILVGYTRYLLKHNTLETLIKLKNSIRLASTPTINSSTPSDDAGPRSSNEIELNEINNSTEELSITTAEDPAVRDESLINSIYKNPALNEELWKPMLFADLKHLLPDVYKDHPNRDQILKTLFSSDSKQQLKGKLSSASTIETEEVITIPIAALDEKMQSKERLAREMAMFPPTPNHVPHTHTSNYYYYYQVQEAAQGSSSSNSKEPLYIPDVPILAEEDNLILASPSAPPIEMLHYPHSQQQQEGYIVEHVIQPPPTYADVVLPRVNLVHHTSAQQKRRHSVS